MLRYDPYSGIHKSQRARLFDLGRRAGTLGPGDEPAIGELARQARALLADIREHAEHEETYFRPWLDSVDPALTARFEAEHRELEPVLDAVDGTAAALEADSGDARTWKRFYSELMRFTARYLLHIDGEEVAVIPGLWARYSDAELVSTVQSFLSARSPAQRAADMGWMLPAVSHGERMLLLRMIRAGRPPEAFEGVRRLAAGVLDPEAYRRLEAELAEGPEAP